MGDLLPSAMALLPRDALGADSESFLIGERALQAPPTVCLQVGDTSGAHDVLITRKVRDGLYHLFDRQRSQSWWHNGPFDLATFLEWYPEPELIDMIWTALLEGRVLDTMYLMRMAQIARGDIGGPLGLDAVAQMHGIRPPTKLIAATVPADYSGGIAAPGALVDVRTSFGLWYGAESIPDPWYSYADYDGEVMLPLASRMVERYCMPAPGRGAGSVLVRLEDLGMVVRNYVGHHLWRTYGLKVNPKAVADLATAARAALARLQDAARINGFLKPALATGTAPSPPERRPSDPKKAATWDKREARKAGHRAALAAGHRPVAVCPVRWESRPDAAGPKRDAWDRRAAKHANCPGCKQQLLDATGAAQWRKDTKALMAAVTLAYEGRPPKTEPKKDKKTGKMCGGGKIAISRHVLQDSQNHELEAWGQYNEYVTLMAKDMAIFARGVVHTRIGIANTLRITSADPNTLNFRRNSFYFATCPNSAVCGYELSVDNDTATKVKKGKLVLRCPHCEPETTQK
jgi:hypothetical protein